MSEETSVITEELAGQSSTKDVSATSASEAETTSSEATEAQSQSPTGQVKTRPKVTIALSRGQELQGKVKTITDFGAFIDINLPQDGLVHISELSRNRVEKVSDVVSVGQEVTVWVKSLDKERNRISLTMCKPVDRSYSQIQVGDVLEGTVTRIEKYGVFVDIGLEREGLVHVSELSHEFVRLPEDVVSVGHKVQVKVVKINKRRKQVNLSMKALLESPEPESPAEEAEEEYTAEDVSVATTMAAAFDRFNSSARGRSQSGRAKSKSRRINPNMDDVVTRTLKSQQKKA